MVAGPAIFCGGPFPRGKAYVYKIYRWKHGNAGKHPTIGSFKFDVINLRMANIYVSLYVLFRAMRVTSEGTDEHSMKGEITKRIFT
jgi:hypothetical protein